MDQPTKGEHRNRGSLTTASLTLVPLDLKNSARATHDTALNACEISRDWLDRSLFLVVEFTRDQDDQGGSEYSLPKPIEIFSEQSISLAGVRSQLYRVAMGSADEKVRQLADRLRFEMGEVMSLFEHSMQLPDREDLLHKLAEDLRALQSPLQELEEATVKSISI